jgi:hypothetical protein
MAICISLLAAAAHAQEFRGSLDVRVVDPTGAAVPSATVTVLDQATSASFTLRTAADGIARFPALSPATYAVAVSAPGFKSQKQNFVVAVSTHSTLRVSLTLGEFRDSIDVTDRGPSLATQPLETSSSVVQTVISSDDLDEIPLSARSFANISLMAPFTAPVEPSDPTKARITAVSFGGSSGLNIDFSVDGGDNNDDFIGGFLQNYSPEAM